MATHECQTRTVARLSSGVRLQITCQRYVGDSDGLTVYIQAAQHGREIMGTEVLRRLHDELLAANLAGEVLAVPVADPLTFDRDTYMTPEQIDSITPNMNRTWPGDANGTLHQRLAAHLWDYATTADVLIDLHTATAETLPHVVYTAGDDDAKQLADVFGADLALAEPAGDDATDEWHDRDFGGKIRVAAHRAGIPCITPELGNSRLLNEEIVELGLEGLKDVLQAVGVLNGTPSVDPPTHGRNHLGRITATESGLFRASPNATLGAEVSVGDHLGTLYAPESYETLQTATVEHDGIVYTLTREAAVKSGDRLASVAVPLDE